MAEKGAGRWPLNRLVPWPAQVFVLLPMLLGLAALSVTVQTHDTAATTRRRQQQRATADIDALFGGSEPGHEVRWMWLLWAARALFLFAALAAVVGGAIWRVRVKRSRTTDT